MQPSDTTDLTAAGAASEQFIMSRTGTVELNFTKGPVQFTKRADANRIEIRGQDGSFAFIDKAHWQSVKAARVEQGLPVQTERGLKAFAWW